MHYFETVHHDPGEDFSTVTSHATLDEAIEYANQHRTPYIYEIGGSWLELRKCDFCKEWIPVSEMTQDLCNDCLRAIEEHAAEEQKTREQKMRQTYRIQQIGFSYEVQNYGLYILDGWADEGWHTVKTFWDEDEARQYIERRIKSLT